MLVGGSYSAERPDVMVIHEMGGFLRARDFRPVFDRIPAEEAGFILGSAAAFLVLEAAEHAAARGARALARLGPVASDRTTRAPGSTEASLAALWAAAGIAAPEIVLAGATGVAPVTAEEGAALARLAPGVAVTALGDLTGHTLETVAPFGAALAAGLVAEKGLREVAVTVVGHRRGEGVIRVTAA
jgi:3-oxoacyl-[acyl-carrier-protein] synthase II